MSALAPGIAEEHCEISHHGGLLEKSRISQIVQWMKGGGAGGWCLLGNMLCSIFCPQ